jgi:hypothetical protein
MCELSVKKPSPHGWPGWNTCGKRRLLRFLEPHRMLIQLLQDTHIAMEPICYPLSVQSHAGLLRHDARRALMKSAAGDRVILQAPGGTEHLTVLEVCYERISVEPFREPPGAEPSAKGLPRRRHT